MTGTARSRHRSRGGSVPDVTIRKEGKTVSGLILGVDICDSYSQVSCFSAEKMAVEPVLLGADETSCLIPTVLCKLRGSDRWLIGSEGYRRALMNEGTMVDKLVKLLLRDGTATIEGVLYSAEDLLTLYLERVLELPRRQYQTDEIAEVVFSLQQLDADLLDRLTRVCDRLGLPRSRVQFLSHTECFAYFAVSQSKDTFTNLVSAFDLTDGGLNYYEMKVLRGRRPMVLEARREALEEAFDLDLLNTPLGEKMADTILSACADRLLQKKVITSVYLTGEGFTSADWAPEFVRKLCNKRKVFLGQHLFADGAAFIAYDSTLPQSNYPYICLCEGRLASTISLYAVRGGKNEPLTLASAGSNWYEAKASALFILDDVHTLEILVTSFATQRVETISLSLAELPARPNKTTRIEVIVSFSSENHVTVRAIDRGFGELFPASGLSFRKDFLIS
ncbi:MAG: hypothetical protein ILP12_02250 [Lachnospiraceae bacterium]|nr:hypothetical protein [Lachnospiraceae bacterium]